jgi:hypothetical protein
MDLTIFFIGGVAPLLVKYINRHKKVYVQRKVKETKVRACLAAMIAYQLEDSAFP